MHRRDMLLLLAAGSSLTVRGKVLGAALPAGKKRGLGLVIYTLGLRQKAMQAERPKRDLFEPLTYLDYCRSLGAGGIQVPLGVRDADYCAKLRAEAEKYRTYIEGIINMPRNDADLERFEAEVRTAGQAGALALRTAILPGRRYEQFGALKEYRAAVELGRQSVLRAAPILERHRVRLAIENHKDQRVEEQVALLRAVSSEYVGACVDLGNNFALLEEPVAVVEALAPWAFSVHIKDQAVREYEEGFLFADVPLGEGFLDLGKMVDALRRAKPDVRFSLETLTRDPLKVPVLTEKYWATFPDVPGLNLARTLRTVKAKQVNKLPEISRLPLTEQVALESAGIARSLQYAREVLRL
jgi:sugar phosphate isomerase/epimerase